MAAPVAAAAASDSHLKRLLYTPPCSVEQLGAKLQVSTVLGSSSVRVVKGAFLSRYLPA